MEQAKAKVHWIQLCNYPAFDKVALHSHEFFHYIYIIQGTGEILLDGQVHPLRQRHMYLMAPGKLHSFWNTGTDRLVTCEIKFHCLNVKMAEQMAGLPDILDVSQTPILGI